MLSGYYDSYAEEVFTALGGFSFWFDKVIVELKLIRLKTLAFVIKEDYCPTKCYFQYENW